jgi:predicted NBD/HSP70 family sugar kinase
MSVNTVERSADAGRRPGSQGALRAQNVHRVLDVLADGGGCTQAELSRRTGLSRATVSNIVRTMVDDGLATASPTTSSGRRATLVRIVGRGAVAVGIDLGRQHTRIVIVGFDRHVIGEREVLMEAGLRGEQRVEDAAQLLDELLAQHTVDRAAIVGVGVGIPSPIDAKGGMVVGGAILPEWEGVQLVDVLEQRLGLPVRPGNDANLGALAQVTWGPQPAPSTLVFLKIGTGIGCGLIIDGRPYYGHLGTAGEIGHSPISDSGAACRCGNRGCFEAAASTSVMVEALGRGRSTPHTTADIVRDALAGETATLRMLEDAGRAAGRALASVVNLLNPEVIVVGGPLAELGELILEPIRRGLLRWAMPLAGASTTLMVSSLGPRAEALGAAALVLRQGQRLPCSVA